jgi:hypothetical protein
MTVKNVNTQLPRIDIDTGPTLVPLHELKEKPVRPRVLLRWLKGS